MNIVQTIVQAVTDMMKGLGTGIVDTFEALFKSSAEGGGMTTFATVALTMLGVGFAFGFVKKLMSKIG